MAVGSCRLFWTCSVKILVHEIFADASFSDKAAPGPPLSYKIGLTTA